MSFKFITSANTALQANEADLLTDIDLEGIFKGQTKFSGFHIGNTGAASATYTFSIDGGESEITDNAFLSLDNRTWQTTVAVSGLKPNGVSELIKVKYTPDVDDYTTDGTFLIDVVES